MEKISDKTVSIMPDVLSREVSGETVLLNLKNERYYGLNEVGTRIWQLLKEQGDLQRVYVTLLQEYDIDNRQLVDDINKIVNDLVMEGLIELR